MKKSTALPAGFAALFFDRSIAWLRVQENDGLLVREDGTKIVISRLNEGVTNSPRVYSLDDVEEIADTLFRQRKMTRKHYDRVKNRVKAFRD